MFLFIPSPPILISNPLTQRNYKIQKFRIIKNQISNYQIRLSDPLLDHFDKYQDTSLVLNLQYHQLNIRLEKLSEDSENRRSTGHLNTPVVYSKYLSHLSLHSFEKSHLRTFHCTFLASSKQILNQVGVHRNIHIAIPNPHMGTHHYGRKKDTFRWSYPHWFHTDQWEFDYSDHQRHRLHTNLLRWLKIYISDFEDFTVENQHFFDLWIINDVRKDSSFSFNHFEANIKSPLYCL